MSLAERRARIEAGHPKLSLSRQCRLLRVSRFSLYHRPKGESEGNRALMRRLDKLFMAYPFYGSRQMVRHLHREVSTWGVTGYGVNGAERCPIFGMQGTLIRWLPCSSLPFLLLHWGV